MKKYTDNVILEVENYPLNYCLRISADIGNIMGNIGIIYIYMATKIDMYYRL